MLVLFVPGAKVRFSGCLLEFDESGQCLLPKQISCSPTKVAALLRKLKSSLPIDDVQDEESSECKLCEDSDKLLDKDPIGTECTEEPDENVEPDDVILGEVGTVDSVTEDTDESEEVESEGDSNIENQDEVNQ